jgi:thiamine-phosphate pyrophosphorylase
MTDPDRVSDPVEIARKLPKGAAIIYRHFGADDRRQTAKALRRVTRKHGQHLLIGADPELAVKVGADGVHFPRDAKLEVPMEWREMRPGWIITMAALKGPQDYKGDLSVLDGLFVSSIFPSKSPSAGDPIGPETLTALAKELPVPIFALGGITQETAPKLIGTGVAGLAAIGGILKEIVMAEIKIEDTKRGYRYVYRLDGHDEAELTMTQLDNTLFDADHTDVPKSMGGQGVGKALIKYMSDHAREAGYKVVPSCPFIAAMWKRKPEWAAGIDARPT